MELRGSSHTLLNHTQIRVHACVRLFFLKHARKVLL